MSQVANKHHGFISQVCGGQAGAVWPGVVRRGAACLSGDLSQVTDSLRSSGHGAGLLNVESVGGNDTPRDADPLVF